MTFQSMLAPVAEDMRRVDELIATRLESDVALVHKVAEYLVGAGGKRLRPALLLLVCGALGYRGEARFTAAALPNAALAVREPRRRSDSSTTSSCRSVAVWMNSTTAASVRRASPR